MRVFGRVLLGLAAAAVLTFAFLRLWPGSSPSRAVASEQSEQREAPLRGTRAARYRADELRTSAVVNVPEQEAEEEVVEEEEEGPTEHPPPDRSEGTPDRSEEIAAELQAQYSLDQRPTAESHRKEQGISKLFSNPKLEGKGRLTELDCRESICRGVIEIGSADDDSEVFSRTFLSMEYAQMIPDAISVTDRRRNPDGSVTAVFYTHPQSIYEQFDEGS
ncbi:MAG: hypothetical protein JW940_31815 [Polyangiaceae bacterium]|nr:hypothetical protein [Polyangiaceae bacterium]